MNAKIAQRLEALRSEMKKAGIYAAIIPHVDPHQSEYIAAHWQCRRWLSGFTGSAGDLVITADKALLWTDSRYFLQGAQQISDTPFELMKDGLPGTPSITKWLAANVPSGQTVGIDGMLFSHAGVESLRNTLQRHAIHLATNFDPMSRIWTDRPALPQDKVIVHDIRFAGVSATDKIAAALAEAATQGADSVLLTALDEIAWTLNIRSTDVPCNPVATSFLYLSPKSSKLFIDSAKLTPETETYLRNAGVDVAPYTDIIPFLSALTEGRVLVDENRVAEKLYSSIRCDRIGGKSVIALAKSRKNDIQISGVRDAMVRDGVALVKSFMEIERRLSAGEKLTEMGVAEILRNFRSASDMFFDISFETIAGYGPHGAIVHYDPTPETDSEIRPEGLLLVDSGAQYFDGTTDITRTVALGTPTGQEMTDFTLVMKGHIALGTAIFPEGTRGAQLDVLARQFLWKNGLSYLHGTGHGVGHFLNVHEGPQSIRLNDVPTPLMPGMITSNEPGVYRENVHGIRCENLVLTVPAFETEFGKFYKFETLTLFPFDRKLFDLSIMTADEIEWVNNYHAMVNDRLSPALDTDAEREWLRNATLPL